MCMLDEIRAKRDEIYAIAKRHKAEKLWVFGSCARREERPDSDVDFLVEYVPMEDPVAFGDNIWDLRFALEDGLHRDVDLINVNNLKNPYFIQELNETKYKIYG